jgi:hypothetical protein
MIYNGYNIHFSDVPERGEAYAECYGRSLWCLRVHLTKTTKLWAYMTRLARLLGGDVESIKDDEDGEADFYSVFMRIPVVGYYTNNWFEWGYIKEEDVMERAKYHSGDYEIDWAECVDTPDVVEDYENHDEEEWFARQREDMRREIELDFAASR